MSEIEHPLRTALREFCLNQIGNDSLVEGKPLTVAIADVLDYIGEDYASRNETGMADDIQRIATALRRV